MIIQKWLIKIYTFISVNNQMPPPLQPVSFPEKDYYKTCSLDDTK